PGGSPVPSACGSGIDRVPLQLSTPAPVAGLWRSRPPCSGSLCRICRPWKIPPVPFIPSASTGATPSCGLRQCSVRLDREPDLDDIRAVARRRSRGQLEDHAMAFLHAAPLLRTGLARPLRKAVESRADAAQKFLCRGGRGDVKAHPPVLLVADRELLAHGDVVRPVDRLLQA